MKRFGKRPVIDQNLRTSAGLASLLELADWWWFHTDLRERMPDGKRMWELGLFQWVDDACDDDTGREGQAVTITKLGRAVLARRFGLPPGTRGGA